MNRHLVVVELDARLFDNVDQAAGWIIRTIAAALQNEAIIGEPVVDLRPVVSCAGESGAVRWARDGVAVAGPPDGNAHLGIATNATLIEELAHRAECGDTDLGLDYRPTVSI